MTIFQDDFSTADIAHAANIPVNSLQNWFKRGVIPLPTGEEDFAGGGVKGKPRRVSFRVLMQVAVAQSLIENCGMDLERAFKAGLIFAHSARKTPYGDSGRCPGLPFERARGRTFLAIGRNDTNIHLWNPNDPQSSNTMLSMIRSSNAAPEGFTLLDTLEVFDRVAKTLGYDPDQVLAAVYAAAPHLDVAEEG